MAKVGGNKIVRARGPSTGTVTRAGMVSSTNQSMLSYCLCLMWVVCVLDRVDVYKSKYSLYFLHT